MPELVTFRVLKVKLRSLAEYCSMGLRAMFISRDSYLGAGGGGSAARTEEGRPKKRLSAAQTLKRKPTKGFFARADPRMSEVHSGRQSLEL